MAAAFSVVTQRTFLLSVFRRTFLAALRWEADGKRIQGNGSDANGADIDSVSGDARSPGGGGLDVSEASLKG